MRSGERSRRLACGHPCTIQSTTLCRYARRLTSCAVACGPLFIDAWRMTLKRSPGGPFLYAQFDQHTVAQPGEKWLACGVVEALRLGRERVQLEGLQAHPADRVG